MTEGEICSMYRNAKNRSKQLPILADLTGKNKAEIIAILLKNGEEVAERDIAAMVRRLDALDAQSAEREREYKMIARALGAPV